ncbi:MAG: TonB-dependent receptor domain-containing protein [Prevotella sp.]
MRRKGITTIITLSALMSLTPLMAWADDIRGRVTDKTTHEPLIGATIMAGEKGAATNADGEFLITGLEKGEHELTVRYIGYKDRKLRVMAGDGKDITIEMDDDGQTLGEVKVTGMARHNTEAAMIEAARVSSVIVSNISAQEIKRAQDTNAGEVVRRVPGVSLIEDKFVMVRGLSQRYNNVWINGGAVPSSEADSRAFSFDIIPSNQIDNLVIVKSPAAQYPADFSGGFIQINTKDIPSENSFSVSVGGNWNEATDFTDFKYTKGSATDFLAFDNGMRMFSGGFNSQLKPIAGEGTVDLLGNGLNNDWRVRSRKPIGDLKVGADWSHRWDISGMKLGMVGALNYTNETRAYKDMVNNLFGVYDTANDRSNYLRQSIDNQYNTNVRIGSLLNIALLSRSGNNKYELKNIFNQLSTNRYTDRTGVNAQSDNETGAEYYYRSRTTYNMQLTGRHTLPADAIDWSASYSYANRRMPDRRRYTIDDALERGTMMLTAGNEINREFTRLDEHILSAGINEAHTFTVGSLNPKIQIGAYGEHRSREYLTRQFIYNWNVADNTLPEGFRQMDMTELLSNEEYFGADRLYLLEEKCMRNNYKGRNTLGAGYLLAALPIGRLDINAGVRYEYNEMELTTNTRDDVESPHSKYYSDSDIFPSLNTTYKIGDRQQMRLSYGRSVNRPEFREVSPSVYYDFDLASHVQGNVALKSCYIHNIDLRYELYPSRGEQITLAGFYKRFDNPIEWTYTVAGGTSLIYSYENAKSADNFGIELDVRKDLSFIGMPGFSLSFNGTLIHSRVNFPESSRNENRPMQGQSPYLINTGLFYKSDKRQLSVSLLYNRIGKRIIGVGRSEGSSGSEDNARVPDSYEMPRDVIDLSISKKFGRHIELKANVRDLLAQNVSYKQFDTVTAKDGQTHEVVQTTRQYKPGRNIGLACVVSF